MDESQLLTGHSATDEITILKYITRSSHKFMPMKTDEFSLNLQTLKASSKPT